ncbi:MAG: hypothetical protein LBD93_08020 [Treponema sp.]|nr:hypothetical protein [Treponema sp.]
MEKQQNAGMSILVKISGLSSFFVLMAIMAFAFISIFSMNSMSLKTAFIMAENKIRGDIVSFHYMIDHEYGTLSLTDGTLMGGGGGG